MKWIYSPADARRMLRCRLRGRKLTTAQKSVLENIEGFQGEDQLQDLQRQIEAMAPNEEGE